MLLRAPGTAVLCHPKGKWAPVWGRSVAWCIPPSLQSRRAGCPLHASADLGRGLPETHLGLDACAQPNGLVQAHQLTGDGCICTPARQTTAPGTVDGRHGIPRLDETSSVPGKPEEEVCVFFPIAQSMFCCLQAQTSSGRVSLFSRQEIFGKNGSVKQTEGITSIEDFSAACLQHDSLAY